MSKIVKKNNNAEVKAEVLEFILSDEVTVEQIEELA